MKNALFVIFILLFGMCLGGFIVARQADKFEARFNIWLETDTGDKYRATAVLDDNGQSIIGHSVFITSFELEYTDPALTTEIWGLK